MRQHCFKLGIGKTRADCPQIFTGQGNFRLKAIRGPAQDQCGLSSPGYEGKRALQLSVSRCSTHLPEH